MGYAMIRNKTVGNNVMGNKIIENDGRKDNEEEYDGI